MIVKFWVFPRKNFYKIAFKIITSIFFNLATLLQDGLKLLEHACKVVEDKISSASGSFNFQMKPKVVTSSDEADLAKQLEQLEQENAEVIINNMAFTYLAFLYNQICNFINIYKLLFQIILSKLD